LKELRPDIALNKMLLLVVSAEEMILARHWDFQAVIS
jgi:hypothetical protein